MSKIQELKMDQKVTYRWGEVADTLSGAKWGKWKKGNLFVQDGTIFIKGEPFCAEYSEGDFIQIGNKLSSNTGDVFLEIKIDW